MPQDYVQRFFGGPPLAVIGRLILMSILVGVILAAIGLDPWNIVDSVRRLIWHLWNMGFDAVRWLWQYFLLGAVIDLASGAARQGAARGLASASAFGFSRRRR